MVENDRFLVTNIRQYLNSDNPKLGEDKLIQELSEFSCPQNSDIEHFLKKSAIEFTKKNQSVTYLVFSLKSMALVGYFTIALKPLTVRGERVNNTIKRKIMRVSDFDSQTQTYTISAYLIAQLGKNYTDGRNKEITGADLLELAWSVIEDMQYCSIWEAEWWCFWRQMTRKGCWRFIRIINSGSLTPGLRLLIQQTSMSWYSF